LSSCISMQKYNKEIGEAKAIIQQKSNIADSLHIAVSSNQMKIQHLERQALMNSDTSQSLRSVIKEIQFHNIILRDSLVQVEAYYESLQLKLNGNDSLYKSQLARLSSKISSLKQKLIEKEEYIQLLEAEKQLLEKQPASWEGPTAKYHIQGNITQRVNYNGKAFTYYKVQLSQSEINMYWKDNTGRLYDNFGRLKNALASQERVLAFATNGGMYHPDRNSVGLYIEKGEEISPLSTIKKGSGNFFLQPNGVFSISKTGKPYVQSTEAYQKLDVPMQYATQSGPMLVIEGEINSLFTENSPNFNIRSGVGILNNNEVVFVISEEKVRFHEIASFFLSIGCKNALYLDGAISQMMLPMAGKFDTGGGYGVIIGVNKK